MSNNLSEPIQLENDKSTKELRIAKREIAKIVKENQKLQLGLKSKNETINSLINQNFTELKNLQEKHDKIINSLAESYELNVGKLESKYKLFRVSMQNKFKDNISTHYRLNNEKVALILEQNKNLTNKMDASQKEIEQKESKLLKETGELETKLKKEIEQKEIKNKQIAEQYIQSSRKQSEMEIKTKELIQINKIMEQQLAEVTSRCEKQTSIQIELDKKISELTIKNGKLETDLHSTKIELSKNSELVKNLTIDTDQVKNAYLDIHNKYVLLLNDNASKQNSIDEKTLDIISFNSKLGETEKKNILLETNRKELNVKLTEYIHQVDNLQTELLSTQKIILQLKMEKDVIQDEKYHHIKEANEYKEKLREIETGILEKIKQIQDINNNERETYLTDQGNKFKDLQIKYDKQIEQMRSEFNSEILAKEKQIDGLINYLKSLTDNQYLVLHEMDKLKSSNEKLKLDNTDVDQKINMVHQQNKKEFDEFKMICKKEKDSLMDSYNDTIKKSQELNDALQNRLSQTIEALGLSKNAISNLKETNQSLEKQLQDKESDDGAYQEKYGQIRSENISLREKLERSIEMNNSFSNKEKHYELQIKQLQTKYSQLIALTKKSINSISQ